MVSPARSAERVAAEGSVRTAASRIPATGVLTREGAFEEVIVVGAASAVHVVSFVAHRAHSFLSIYTRYVAIYRYATSGSVRHAVGARRYSRRVALYRKYRPATFAEVVGQEHVTAPLSTALDEGRINHAYLFSGPRGCGKTSSARILARSLNCEQGPTSTPCGTCGSCRSLGPGGAGNLDVTELDAASHNGVENARELRDRAFFAPAESRYRIFIIDEAHMVTPAAFNALLKIVEEPPEHLIFVFATTEPDKVLPTIRSRTHHYPFRLLAPNTMRGLLEKICAQENVPIEDAVYPLVVRAGGGSPRDSLSAMDQLLAGAGPGGVTYAGALALLGITDVALIDDAVESLAASDGAALFGTVEKVMESGHDPRRFAVDLLDRLRDLILIRNVPDAAERGLIDAPADVLDRIRDQASRIGPATLTRYAELVHDGLGEMRGATSPRLLLEVMCARMLLPAASDAESAVLQRLERLEQGSAGVPAAVAAQPVPTVAAMRSTPEPPVAPIAPDEPAARFQRPSQRRAAEGQATSASVDSSRGTPGPAAPEPTPVEPAPVEPAPVEPAPVVNENPTPEIEPVAAGNHSNPVAEQEEPSTRPERTQASELNIEKIRAAWSDVRAEVRLRSRTVEVMLSGAIVRGVEGHRVVLAHDSMPLVKRLAEPRNAAVVADAMRTVLGADVEVTCVHGSAAPTPAPTRSTAPKQKAGGQPRFSRPSQAKREPAAEHPAVPEPQRPDEARSRSQRPEFSRRSEYDDIPPPEAPDLPDDPGPIDSAPPDPSSMSDADVEEMFAEAATPADPTLRRDPDEIAAEVLRDILGAKPLEGK